MLRLRLYRDCGARLRACPGADPVRRAAGAARRPRGALAAGAGRRLAARRGDADQLSERVRGRGGAALAARRALATAFAVGFGRAWLCRLPARRSVVLPRPARQPGRAVPAVPARPGPGAIGRVRGREPVRRPAALRGRSGARRRRGRAGSGGARAGRDGRVPMALPGAGRAMAAAGRRARAAAGTAGSGGGLQQHANRAALSVLRDPLRRAAAGWNVWGSLPLRPKGRRGSQGATSPPAFFRFRPSPPSA
jgi:hypothetical protein